MLSESLNQSDDAEDLLGVLASSWGPDELAREITLLEGMVRRDRLEAMVDDAIDDSRRRTDGTAYPGSSYVSTEDEIASGRVVVVEGVNQLFSDYAISAAISRAFSLVSDIEFLRASSNRLRSAYGGYFSLAAIHKLGIATGLLRLATVLRAACAEQLKLRTIADSACFRVPLFSYGPELSWFRHRLRLTLA